MLEGIARKVSCRDQDYVVVRSHAIQLGGRIVW